MGAVDLSGLCPLVRDVHSIPEVEATIPSFCFAL